MKNKILLVVMLLLTFFGLAFSGLSSVEVKATTDTVSYDINAINVPSNVISSFPVTYKSVHGNTITWTVQEGQEVITYDEEAHWMVVNRPESGMNSVVSISVTVSDGENSQTKNFEIKVPAGKTAAPKYTITYTNGNDVTTDTYKLGDPTKVLQAPSAREGYTFDGWYEGETKVEKILVGSARNYNLEARWTLLTTELLESMFSFGEDEFTYDGTEKELSVSSKELVLNTDYTVSYENNTNAGTNTAKVIVTGKGKYTGTIIKTYSIAHATINVNLKEESKNVEINVGETKNWTLDDFSYELPEGLELDNLLVTYKDVVGTPTSVGAYEVSFSAELTGTTKDNYNLVFESTTLTITGEVNLSQLGTYTYNGTDQTLTAQAKTKEGVEISGGTFTYDGNATLVKRNAGSYEVTVKFTHETYGTVEQKVTFTIKKAQVEKPAADATEFIYNGSEQTYTLQANDNYKISGNIQTNADTHKVTVSLNEKDNFEWADGSTDDLTYNFVIQKAQVTVTVDDVSSKYGEELNVPTFIPTGVINNELVFTGKVTEVTSTSKPGTYEDKTTVSYTENSNYEVTIIPGDYEITKREIKVSAIATGHTYGEELSVLEYVYITEQYDTVLDADKTSVDDLISISTTATNNSDAGVYDITLSASESDYYNITVDSSAKYTVTAKSLTSADVTITLEGSDYNVQNETYAPGFIVVLKNTSTELTYENVEYTYENAETKVGKATVSFDLIGNYSGTLSTTFEVTEVGMAAEVAKEIREEVQISGNVTAIADLPTGNDLYTITWNSSNTAVVVVSESGAVTVIRSTTENTNIVLTGTIQYGTTSVDYVTYNFVVPMVEFIDVSDNDADVTVQGVQTEVKSVKVETVTPETGNIEIEGAELQCLASYDITLLDSNEQALQPYQAVTVKLPIPDGYTAQDTFYVYHINGEEKTPVECSVEGKYIVFTTTHFSVYSIWAEKVEVEEPEYIFDFSSLTGKGAEFSDNSDKQTFIKCLKNSSIISDVTLTKVYNGNGSGGNYQSAGLIKLGAGNVGGTIVITFKEIKLSKAVISCHAWNIGEKADITVNGQTLALPNSGSESDLSFEFDASNVITISTSARAFMFSISFAGEVELTDEEKLVFDREKLIISETVTDELELPVEGTYSTITWESDNTEVINIANDGTVTINRQETNVQVKLTATLNYNGLSETKPFMVTVEPENHEQDGDATPMFVKVTSAPSDWSGTYLIVYEDGDLAFNGGLTTLDAVKNTVAVKISENKIEASEAMKAASFNIAKSGSGYTIKSASGYYIGQTKNDNGLKGSTSTQYSNTISFNADGTVNFVSGGAYLRYNATSGQERFRYFKSSTYAGQKAICLYKLSE